MSLHLKKASVPDLSREPCLALTTFRKSGQAVTTPVMFSQYHGTISVGTRADAGKLKRLCHTACVTLAPCNYSGKVIGTAISGKARILTEPAECAEASMALAKKYGLMLPLARTA